MCNHENICIPSYHHNRFVATLALSHLDVHIDIHIYIYIYICITLVLIYWDLALCVFHESTFFIILLSGVRLTTVFQNVVEKKELHSFRSNFLVFQKTESWLNLVNNACCKCSLLWLKVRETFLVLGDKEQ